MLGNSLLIADFKILNLNMFAQFQQVLIQNIDFYHDDLSFIEN